MSTIVEIETAIAQLPPEQWSEIRRWMDEHSAKIIPQTSLQLFRRLQCEIGLTAEAATNWKNAATEARR